MPNTEKHGFTISEEMIQTGIGALVVLAIILAILMVGEGDIFNTTQETPKGGIEIK